MEAVKARVLEKPSCMILEVRQSGVVDGGDFEGRARHGQTDLLSAKAPAIQQHVDFLKDDILATEEMGNGGFVQMDIKSSTDVTQEFQQPIPQRTAHWAGVTPLLVCHLKNRSVGTLQRRVDEFMLHLLGAEIHKFAVGELAKQKVVQQLRSVGRPKSLDRFQFKHGSTSVQQIHIVFFAEIVEQHLNQHLCLRITPDASRDGITVDVLVQKSSHFVVDRKDVIHNVIRDLSKLILIQVVDVRVDFDGHRCVSCFDRKIDDRKMRTSDFSVINLSVQYPPFLRKCRMEY
jgi:hypothetical protein